MPTFVEYKCENCGGEFSRRKGYGSNGRFCSRSCTASGTQAGWNRTPFVTVYCRVCGSAFERREAYIRRVGGKTCSITCHNRRIAAETKVSKRFRGRRNPGWTTGIQVYRRHRKQKCERCGSKKFLCVHHRDRDRKNNKHWNLQTLCKRCHQVEHGCMNNLPKTPRPITFRSYVCRHCGHVYERRAGYAKTIYCGRPCYFAHRYGSASTSASGS